MTLILSNDDVNKVLNMPDCLTILEDAYRGLSPITTGNFASSGVARRVNLSRFAVLVSPALRTVRCQVQQRL